MKKFARLLTMALTTLLFPTASWTQNYRIGPENLKFVYQTWDGETRYPCIHTLLNPLTQDWSVECRDDIGAVRKTYTVHLWVSSYQHPSPPKQSYEILYWIQDKARLTTRGKTSGGGTSWINLKEPSDVLSLSLSQAVDNDSAGLYLDINFK